MYLQDNTSDEERLCSPAIVLYSGHPALSRKTASVNVSRTSPPDSDALRPPCSVLPAETLRLWPTRSAGFSPLAIFRSLMFPGRRGEPKTISRLFPTIFIARFGDLPSARALVSSIR